MLYERPRIADRLSLDDFMNWIVERNPGETEFHQAVHEVAEAVVPYINANPGYADMKVLHRMAEPDRVVSFRVTWSDDNREVQVNRGYRVQFNNSIGPYKGGLRFHPSVNQSVLKFLGFEQTFKNSLTGLPMGGAKGGADFDPKGRSEHEIMSFCQSFMTELHRHIGVYTDVPAGDIGVGSREIGYMFGAYKRMTNRFEGVLTGKALEYGGSLMRPESTGYGAVYFLEDMLHHRQDQIEGKVAVISGSGNVATHAAEKICHRGGKVLTLSDSDGFIHDPAGITEDKIDWVKEHKRQRGNRISAYADRFAGATFHAGEMPWGVPCDMALPCATQNELDVEAARTLLANGCIAVSEGANMPCTAEAVHAFQAARIAYAPGKASNAGGVAVSGLEMSQNSARLHRTEEDLRDALRKIMDDIHAACVRHGAGEGGYVDYVKGANIAGFKKVADAMLAFGVV
ncbi:MAG TPA: NADP-specific glutamate dehydrogenase [Paracoccaceae bacterium]|nr:NADP-specific glutamate dehydrogenase [Paracoccaceae bacterium]